MCEYIVDTPAQHRYNTARTVPAVPCWDKILYPNPQLPRSTAKLDGLSKLTSTIMNAGVVVK